MTSRALTALSGAILAFAAGASVAGPSSVVMLSANSHAEAPSLPDQASDTAKAQVGTPEETAGAPTVSAVELPECPADVKNHGEYVSSIASADHEPGREHGELVSAAAQSDCGKPEGGDEASESEDKVTGEDADAAEHPAKDKHPSKESHPHGRPDWAGSK